MKFLNSNNQDLISASFSISVIASANSIIIAVLSALSFSGRLRVSVPMLFCFSSVKLSRERHSFLPNGLVPQCA